MLFTIEYLNVHYQVLHPLVIRTMHYIIVIKLRWLHSLLEIKLNKLLESIENACEWIELNRSPQL